MLKKMNTSYPKISSDFDGEFIRHLLKSIFSEEELNDCSKSSSLRDLNRPKLKFAKGEENEYVIPVDACRPYNSYFRFDKIYN